MKRSEGLLHLEVVGNPAAPGRAGDARPRWRRYLGDQGAQHLVRGEVWDDQGQPAGGVTALVAASKLSACQRPAPGPRRQPHRRPARAVRVRPQSALDVDELVSGPLCAGPAFADDPHWCSITESRHWGRPTAEEIEVAETATT